MKKIIFLDIDGVCNSSKYFDSELSLQQAAGKSDAQIMLVSHDLHLDPAALQLINELVDQTGAEVVVSSTWKSTYTIDAFNKLFTARGATFKVVGRTPTIHGSFQKHVPRGREIKAYLDDLEVQPDAFVILDDRDDMNQLFKYLVKTNVIDGFTRIHLARAIQILNGDT